MKLFRPIFMLVCALIYNELGNAVNTTAGVERKRNTIDPVIVYYTFIVNGNPGETHSSSSLKTSLVSTILKATL